MSILARALPLTLVGLVLTGSCGALDGGGRGTGITTTAQGNVAEVSSASDQKNSVDGIKVTIAPHGKGVTDSAGVFSVQGRFEGHLTVLFTRRTDGIRASLPIFLPSGGILTLNGVEIDNTHGTATADSEEVDFLGEITRADCAAETLFMLAAKRPPKDTDVYAVQLDTSSLEDSQGNPLACSAVRSGQVAHVQGTVNPDNSFGHAKIVIE